MKLSAAIKEFTEWKALNVTRSTMRGYNLILRQFALFTRDMEMEDVKVQNIVEWFNLMQELGWDTNGFLPRSIALRKMFEYYGHKGVKALDPWLIPVPRVVFKNQRVADEESYQKLLDIIPTETNDPRHIRNRVIIQLLWDTGARNGEICSLDVSMMDVVNCKAVIKTEKAKIRRPVREIFWTQKTNNSLKEWLVVRERLAKKMYLTEKDALFFSLCNVQAGNRFNMKGLGEMIRRYCHKAGIPVLNAHSFRHHMGHHIIKSRGTNSDVSNILGHSSLASSYVYTQMTNLELQDRYRHFMEDTPRATTKRMVNAEKQADLIFYEPAY